MIHIARLSAVLVAAVCGVWVLALITIPIVYARLKGWGYYVAFSPGELLGSLLFLVGPPLLFIFVWRRARRRSDGEGAV